MDFSEEGQIFTQDSVGIIRSFSFTTQTWSVRMDLREKFLDQARQVWIVGVSDQEILYIELG